ncbi:DUF3883 domain-containing protein [Corticibacter populi]|uniref:DUF3883 domain-containing protein n=1 Tax=Corticibacter populi TaxID=1550736 RepID=A0A3M6QS49_9BURK|nr:DUF3883 domain-containing protein [Corticibacter populi]RMX05671.1 DUF3883 domain-containing protein [Corticibacter populi]RZS31046.1 uncharacterized protein DUF3883 [Corticibacter populi]
MPILFCNVGWMERYQGIRTDDQISGGGAYVKKEGRGHEVCNFSPDKDTLYGYVQAPGAQINLDRLGATSGDDSITGTTVVWTATRPGGGTTIVGWYKDATVFRDYKKFKNPPRAQSQNGIDGYRITAPAGSATLLPVDARVFEIPRQVKGGMGQSNVWYADSPESAELVEKVRELIESGQSPHARRPKHDRAQDQERKARVEKAAVHACCTHFEKLGYDVVSVEKDNVGWDLVAKSGRSSLRIEVKGLSGTAFSIELTPNEYNAFAQQANDYRLAVVTDALKSPRLSICRYSNEQTAWVVEDNDGRALEIKVKQSASITCI